MLFMRSPGGFVPKIVQETRKNGTGIGNPIPVPFVFFSVVKTDYFLMLTLFFALQPDLTEPFTVRMRT